MKTQDGVQALEGGYETSHRVYETCGVALTSLTGLWLAARLAGSCLQAWWFVPALCVGLLGADLVSGLVHWGFDTWGDLDTPIVGRLAIRAFRQHHIDPDVMLHHDFIETNGHNITLSLVLTAGGLCVVPAGANPTATFAGLCMFLMAICVSFTSQIHKWAHMEHAPRLVRLLQRSGLILSPEHHRQHHVAPHRSHYCITVGWMNGLLHATRALTHLERLIERSTGIAPRRSDG